MIVIRALDGTDVHADDNAVVLVAGVDRQVAGDDFDLALLARAVAATRRVDRDAVPARSVEHRRSGEHARLLDRTILARLEKTQAYAVRVDLGELRQRLGAHDAAVASACFLRKSAIQREPHSSRPSSRQARS